MANRCGAANFRRLAAWFLVGSFLVVSSSCQKSPRSANSPRPTLDGHWRVVSIEGGARDFLSEDYVVVLTGNRAEFVNELPASLLADVDYDQFATIGPIAFHGTLKLNMCFSFELAGTFALEGDVLKLVLDPNPNPNLDTGEVDTIKRTFALVRFQPEVGLLEGKWRVVSAEGLDERATPEVWAFTNPRSFGAQYVVSSGEAKR